MTSEQDLIDRLVQRSGPVSVPGVELGIGDDAAILGASRFVIATDVLVAGRDLPVDLSPIHLAHKAIGANLSDLAAMGARPWTALSVVGIPPGDSVRAATVLEALAAACEETGLALVGGDLSSASEWFISLTVLGIPVDRPWRRDGARPGDELWYLGSPAGLADLGLALLKAGAAVDDDGTVHPPSTGASPTPDAVRQAAEAVSAQVRPRPLTAPWTRISGDVHAAIDLSDGLLIDSRRLAMASAVQLDIELGRVPVVEPLPPWNEVLGPCDGFRAVTAGEDFALLLVTAPGSRVEGGHRIGRVRDGQGIQLYRLGQPLSPPQRLGWDHLGGPA